MTVKEPRHPPLKIHQVSSDTPDLLDTLIQQFVEVFPHDKRYAKYIQDCAHLSPQETPLAIIHQWLFEYQGEFIGFRLFNYLRRRNFGFSRYVGILPQYRGYGFGRIIHGLSVEQISLDAQKLGHPVPIGLCGELDHPAAAPNKQETQIRETRLAIFRQLGTIVMEEMDYFEPHMIQGIATDEEPDPAAALEPDPMLLYLAPIKPVTRLTPVQMANLVTGVLVDNYRLKEDSRFLHRALASIGQLDD